MTRVCPSCGGRGGRNETRTVYRQEAYTDYETHIEYTGYPPQPHSVTVPVTRWRTVPETTNVWVSCLTCDGTGRVD